ncbi:glycosyltransferase [Sphingomonas fennica]|uniref:Uncharacterized protein n=1 Tax=Edaphosphingomonas fennica TaxID=114404 RepID=A0A2T4HZS9_9SPHN|nr:glycosyltransferase [Sphingomonas fennica]PTD21985.1 hypothetical protein CV103_09380 [Sphingomonas fennica]
MNLDVELFPVAGTISKPSIQVVSFDVFDTAVVRPFLRPDDLFEFIGRDVREIVGNFNIDFRKIRMKAEKDVRIAMEAAEIKSDPNIDQIYDQLCDSHPGLEPYRNEILQLELSAECGMCYKNERIFAIYKHAISSGKRVIFITDTYLSKDIVKTILHNAGFTQYEDIFVSNEMNLAKKFGNIYPAVRDIIRVDFENVLHIGDNFKSDVERAKEHGIFVLNYRKNSDDVVAKARPAAILWENTNRISLAKSINIGLISHKLNRNNINRLEPRDIFRGNLYDLGYSLLGPFLAELSAWLANHARTNGCSNLIFLARDGYLPKAAFDLMQAAAAPKQKIDTNYVYVSRKAILPYRVLEGGVVSTLFDIAFAKDFQVRDFLSHRLGRDLTDSLLASDADLQAMAGSAVVDVRDRLIDALQHHEPMILVAMRNRCKAADIYYSAALPDNSRSLIFDVGRKGTFQSFFHHTLKKDVIGAYVVTHSDINKTLLANEFFTFYNHIHLGEKSSKLDTILFEALLSSTSGSVEYFDESGTPVFSTPSLSDLQRQNILAVQDGALAFVQDLTERFGHKCLNVPFDSGHFDRTFRALWKYPTDAALFHQLPHEDSMSTADARSLHDIYFNRNDRTLRRGLKTILIYCPALTRVRGGVERVVSYIASDLDQNYNVVILTSGDPSVRHPRPVFPLPDNVRLHNIRVGDRAAIDKMIDRYKFRAAMILASGPVVREFVSALSSRKIPFLLSERADPAESFQTYWKDFKKSDYINAYRKATLVAVQFNSFRRYFPKAVQRKMRTIPNPVPAIRAHEDIQRENQIICVARLFLEQKQQDLLVRAFAEIAEEFPQYRLVLYGKDQAGGAAALEELTQSLGLAGRVLLKGETKYIFDALAQAKLFVLPSRFEGFPNALAEALASGENGGGKLDHGSGGIVRLRAA